MRHSSTDKWELHLRRSAQQRQTLWEEDALKLQLFPRSAVTGFITGLYQSDKTGYCGPLLIISKAIVIKIISKANSKCVLHISL